MTRVGEAGETDWCAKEPHSESPVSVCGPQLTPAGRIVTPHRLGLYEFKCTVAGHERMKGVIEVVV